MGGRGEQVIFILEEVMPLIQLNFHTRKQIISLERESLDKSTYTSTSTLSISGLILPSVLRIHFPVSTLKVYLYYGLTGSSHPQVDSIQIKRRNNPFI